jgi:putative oxidoreductase
MYLSRKMESLKTWKMEHRESKVLAGLRVVLGLLLIYKGLYFIMNSDELKSALFQSRFQFGSIFIAHYIVLVHISGGLLIASGILTRVAVLFQLPILLGAVIFMNSNWGVFPVYSEFILSVIVLLMLVFYLFYGNGIYSGERFLKSERFYQ